MSMRLNHSTYHSRMPRISKCTKYLTIPNNIEALDEDNNTKILNFLTKTNITIYNNI